MRRREVLWVVEIYNYSVQLYFGVRTCRAVITTVPSTTIFAANIGLRVLMVFRDIASKHLLHVFNRHIKA